MPAIPLIPLRDVVVYPSMVIPLFVGREKSVQALEQAMAGDKQVLLVAQKTPDIDDPAVGDLYEIGTLATILQLLKLPDGTVKVLVEGQSRARLLGVEGYLASYESLEAVVVEADSELEALIRTIRSVFDQYVNANSKVPDEAINSVASLDDPGQFADTVAGHMNLRIEQKQQLLEADDIGTRLEALLGLLEGEMELMQVERRIRKRVRKQMEKSQKEYYLNEQQKAIQKELGDMDEAPSEVDELAAKIEKVGLSKEARKKADAELKKLRMMPPMSAEATVVRNYLDTLTNVPWKKRSRLHQDLARAEKILDEDHYGLDKVKERILEHLAVQQRVKRMGGPILCLVGPPGVGKTSLGKSIARATGREFLRVALGGVRDEAEIRGHRRTYIGSMPGKIIQNMSKAGARNPFFLLDEIDKMSTDFRGDPSSALLEVLDPEQNNSFGDHYLEVDYDLSEVMFVCTANSLNIPAPLLDRMEVIHLSGYTEDEKLNICQRYLVPKQRERNGLAEDEMQLSEAAIRDIVRHYTREAGVRSLEREVAKICRKVVHEIAMSQAKTSKKDKKNPAAKAIKVGVRNLEKYLGVRRFRYGEAERDDRVGQVTGLAWTEVGGDLLTIETAVVPGKGKLVYTGQLGEVMQESIQAAMTVVRSRADTLGFDPDFSQNLDVHFHVPEGATPKDGPSAGAGMCTALVSALSGVPVRAQIAMTGEITLRGEVLPIGGLKEKLLAAHRGGIAKVLIPEENVKDLADIPDNIKAGLEIVPVKWIDSVLEHALTRVPAPGDAPIPAMGLAAQDAETGTVRPTAH